MNPLQDPVAIRGRDPNLPHDIALSSLSAARLCRPQKADEVTAADAESGPLLLLALSALPESRDDRRQYVLAPTGGPAAPHYPGYFSASILRVRLLFVEGCLSLINSARCL